MFDSLIWVVKYKRMKLKAVYLPKSQHFFPCIFTFKKKFLDRSQNGNPDIYQNNRMLLEERMTHQY
jgi:hypothetical protein